MPGPASAAGAQMDLQSRTALSLPTRGASLPDPIGQGNVELIKTGSFDPGGNCNASTPDSLLIQEKMKHFKVVIFFFFFFP